ncbi:hypothetical protein [Polyangium sp. 6x1]|uniref:hypothetical protein n=1 Tax=Polyangium sp. 6x1 TaxID=3042689 RepID=UPI002482BF66|nr:hypothetical protein [Polyangium sp. 6x1]MDI1449342.1 hypothetical protein [Polyangium sp. 6x1]
MPAYSGARGRHSRGEPRRPGEEHEHELAAVLAALAALAEVMVEPNEAEDQGASCCALAAVLARRAAPPG